MTDSKEEYIYTFKNMENDEIKVFLPKFEIDMETMKQIKHMSEHSILRNIRIMPDCHRGHGCCVGLTAFIDNKIFPRYVG
jgi:RNA-splicing ligase RtcB